MVAMIVPPELNLNWVTELCDSAAELDREQRDALHAVPGAGIAGPLGDELVIVAPKRGDGEAGVLDQLLVCVLLRRAADARCPKISVTDDRVLQLPLADDVGDRQSATRSQHPGRFGEHSGLIRGQVDHAVGDHESTLPSPAGMLSLPPSWNSTWSSPAAAAMRRARATC